MHNIKRVALVCAALLLAAPAVFAQTLTFTVATTRATETAVPRLTWVVTPAATSCTASGDAAWSGTKNPAGGTETLASINVSKTYALTCNWAGSTSAALTWTPPTTFTNGAPLTSVDLLRYTIARSTSASDVLVAVNPPASVTVTNHNIGSGAEVTGITTPGIYFFCVRAVAVGGVFSDCGKQSDGTYPAKTIASTTSQNRSVSVTVDPKPSPPTSVRVE